MVLILVAYASFALLGALSVSLPMLLAARLLLGVTIGVTVVVVPVYVAESAPAAVRGSLLTAYQLAIVSGLIVGYLTGYLLAGTHSWRWMLGLAAVPAMLLLPLLIRMPDTARWYLLKGRVDDARRALLRVEPAARVDEELAEIGRAVSEGGGGMSEMLRPPYLRATLFVITLGFLIQITGINAIIYYSPRIFEAMGFTGNFALLGLPALVQVAGLAAVGAVAASRRPGGPAPNPVVRHRHDDRRRRRADGRVRPGHSAARFSGSPAYCCSSSATPWASAPWAGCTPARASRPGYGPSGRARCSPPTWWPTRSSRPSFLTMLHSLGGAGTFAVFAVLAVVAFGFVYRYAPGDQGAPAGRDPALLGKRRPLGRPVPVIRAGTMVLDGRVCRPGWLQTSGGQILACGAGAPPAASRPRFPGLRLWCPALSTCTCTAAAGLPTLTATEHRRGRADSTCGTAPPRRWPAWSPRRPRS